MTSPLAHSRRLEAQPAEVLLQLLSDAGATDITTRHRPSEQRHGWHAVTFAHDGRRHSAEGSTLTVALRRALRAAGAECAHTTSTREDPDR